MTMYWVDPTDPDVVEAIIGPGGTVQDAEDAIAVASDLLTRLTGHIVHPAGTTVETFYGATYLQRLSPVYRPLQVLKSVIVASESCDAWEDITAKWCVVHGGYVKRISSYRGSVPLDVMHTCVCCRGNEIIRMTYDFGSTLTPIAERACIDYAHQVYLADHPEAGECLLPERVTSVNREGISWTVIDPQQYLDQGRTGVPSVDQFLAAMNPSKGKRPAGVYIPEAPPGVPYLGG